MALFNHPYTCPDIDSAIRHARIVLQEAIDTAIGEVSPHIPT